MKKLTIKDIARMAKVSPTAVSFVINNKSGVSEETRKKVKKVIEQNNFKPNLNSRRLSLKKSYNISIVIRQTSSPFDDLFYLEIAKGILEKSKKYGYNIVFTDVAIENNNVNLPEIIKQNDTDGIIFLQDTKQNILNEIDKYKIPYVVVDTHSQNSNISSVSADYELSSYTATKYLVDNNHKDIAFICSSFIPEYYNQALTGFKRALDEKNLSLPLAWIQSTAKDEISAYECMNNILKIKPYPTAIFCAGDMFAIGAIKCAKDLNLLIPDNISIVSIDDILLSRYFEPKITTIAIDMFKMGTIAMEMIIKKINNEEVENAFVESDNLLIRDSVLQI